MSTDVSPHHRRRAPTQGELAAIPWLGVLDQGQRERVALELKVSDAHPADFICRAGRPVTYRFGVIGGLLKMSRDNADGQTMSFAGLPVDTFHWLLDHSIGFNRFVLDQLNERLSQFIAAREIDRMNNPDARVARSLAALFNPILYPGVGEVLRITQQELVYLVGLSRQRVNEALSALQARGVIRVEYGGLRVLRLGALRSSVFPNPAAASLPANAAAPLLASHS